jgi:glycosyltransferase involved in cell wall biosynthesis
MGDARQDPQATAGLISVVIPCHDGERYVAETIRSVLDQAHRPLEIIVVDDGSNDRSAQAVLAFGDAVRLARQPHRGAAAARNRGVALATGELITFLDADDLWTPHALPRMRAALAANPDAGMVVGQMEQFASPELSDETRATFHFSPEPVAARMCGTVLVRRREFDRVGGFTTGLASGEFIDWIARADEAGVAAVAIPDVVLRRRLHGRNHGLVRREARQDYVRLVKAALDRRRAAARGPDA